MNKNKNDLPNQPPKTYKYYLGSRQRYITISCDFQSGNIEVIRQLSQFNYRLQCIDDGVRTEHRVNSKSWFYFRVQGFPKNTKGKFTINRVQTLMSVFNDYPKSYRPVFRQYVPLSNTMLKQQQYPVEANTLPEWSEWKRLQSQCVLVLRETGQLQCTFEYLFVNQNHMVQFAFNYPYTYSQNQAKMNELNQYYSQDQFYFHKEILIRSPQQRNVHLLTITSHDLQDSQQEYEEIFQKDLFPEKCRPKKFNKPVVLISARVHPGESPSSFALEGIVNFLVNSKDLRAHLLRKMFLFMIVPMINVDGVFHGNFRMDSYGKNLNRFYIQPDLQKQPAIYAIKELASHLSKDNRLAFYFDLHAHNAKKGAFIYGNAINDFVEQVQSQVFCKIFHMNHKGFEYDQCNFSTKQMNSKDRNQDLTKEGCGRVVMHKMANIIHSYSLECGIISSNSNNVLPTPMNQSFQVNAKTFIPDSLEQQDIKSTSTSPESQPLFTDDMYRNLGKNLLVSILDVFDKNPYSRLYSSNYKSIDMLRRITAFEVFHKAERFRMFEKYVYGKVKNINELIKDVLNSKLHYKELYNFYFYDDEGLKAIKWPENITGLARNSHNNSHNYNHNNGHNNSYKNNKDECSSALPSNSNKLKRFRSMNNEPNYSLSFLSDLKENKKLIQQHLWDLNSHKHHQLLEPFEKDSCKLQEIKEKLFDEKSSETSDQSEHIDQLITEDIIALQNYQMQSHQLHYDSIKSQNSIHNSNGNEDDVLPNKQELLKNYSLLMGDKNNSKRLMQQYYNYRNKLIEYDQQQVKNIQSDENKELQEQQPQLDENKLGPTSTISHDGNDEAFYFEDQEDINQKNKAISKQMEELTLMRIKERSEFIRNKIIPIQTSRNNVNYIQLNAKIHSNDSPSVRVRRLLKQENKKNAVHNQDHKHQVHPSHIHTNPNKINAAQLHGNSKKMTGDEIKQKLGQIMVNNPQPTEHLQKTSSLNQANCFQNNLTSNSSTMNFHHNKNHHKDNIHEFNQPFYQENIPSKTTTSGIGNPPNANINHHYPSNLNNNQPLNNNYQQFYSQKKHISSNNDHIKQTSSSSTTKNYSNNNFYSATQPSPSKKSMKNNLISLISSEEQSPDKVISQKPRIKSTNFNLININVPASSSETKSCMQKPSSSPSKIFSLQPSNMFIPKQTIKRNQFPAISPHFFIISTSAKGLNKKY